MRHIVSGEPSGVASPIGGNTSRVHMTYSNPDFAKGVGTVWRAFTALRRQDRCKENEENRRLPVGTRRSRESAGLLGEFPAKESQAHERKPKKGKGRSCVGDCGFGGGCTVDERKLKKNDIYGGAIWVDLGRDTDIGRIRINGKDRPKEARESLAVTNYCMVVESRIPWLCPKDVSGNIEAFRLIQVRPRNRGEPP